MPVSPSCPEIITEQIHSRANISGKKKRPIQKRKRIRK